MYHGRFSGTHYDAGFKWGCRLLKNGKKLDHCPTFEITKGHYDFAGKCALEYQKHFPEILEEIQGIAEGNDVPVETVQAMLFSMYCFELDNKCTCFAFSTDQEIVFARNSDFLVSLEKLYMNCLYSLKGSYRFNGNTTAFAQMEDGVNQHGLAVGLTFIYPKLRKPGLNSGMLTRYLLEKCKTTAEALAALHRLPIASAQTLTIADTNGEIVVVECNPKEIVTIRPCSGEQFVATANNFNSKSCDHIVIPTSMTGAPATVTRRRILLWLKIVVVILWNLRKRFCQESTDLCASTTASRTLILSGLWSMT